jgi:2-methylcitrate dehydratase PrpD
MTIERALAEWAAQPCGMSLDHATRIASDAFVDITGCIIGGSVEAPTRTVARIAGQAGGGSALGMGTDLRLPAAWAALLSATAAHALDFDDNFAPATTHATAVLAPALFALADEDNLSGKEVMAAYVVGLELQARIGRLMNPSHYERGWHATSTVGAIGTAGACAHLLGLDADQTLAAMSIAFSMAGGSKKQFGSMLKPIHAGLAAKNAVLAARMAQAGVTADTRPLTGKWGFMELYAGAADEDAAMRLALDGLGETLAIEQPGLLMKRFPCCGAAHRTLDGLAQLRDRHQFLPDEVDRVDAFIPAFARDNLRYDDPTNENEARFSLTYCAARVLQNGRLSLNDMTLERVRDPGIRPLLRRFVLHLKPGSVSDELGENATAAMTRVVLKSGATHEVAIAVSKGSRLAPLTENEKREKFDDCCRWAGKSPLAARLFELAQSIHQLPRFPDFSRGFSEAFHRA